MRYLSEREERLLQHIRRYRITTAEVVGRLFFMGNTIEGETALLRLAELECLEPPRRLYEGKEYFTLSTRARFEMFYDEAPLEPMKRQALIKAYGILCFCCLGQYER